MITGLPSLADLAPKKAGKMPLDRLKPASQKHDFASLVTRGDFQSGNWKLPPAKPGDGSASSLTKIPQPIKKPKIGRNYNDDATTKEFDHHGSSFRKETTNIASTSGGPEKLHDQKAPAPSERVTPHDTPKSTSSQMKSRKSETEAEPNMETNDDPVLMAEQKGAQPELAALIPEFEDQTPQEPTPLLNPNTIIELQQLGQTFKSLSPLEKTVPSVALVTGNLQYIQPEKLTELISNNPFIKKGLSSNIESFLNDPMTIEDLFDSLEFGPEKKSIAESLQINMGSKVTPENFFKFLGIDPRQVKVELELLKSNIQLEGLTPYLQRAALLSPKQGLNQPSPKESMEGVSYNTQTQLTKVEPAIKTPTPLTSDHSIEDFNAQQSYIMRKQFLESQPSPESTAFTMSTPVESKPFMHEWAATAAPTARSAKSDPFSQIFAGVALKDISTLTESGDMPSEGPQLISTLSDLEPETTTGSDRQFEMRLRDQIKSEVLSKMLPQTVKVDSAQVPENSNTTFTHFDQQYYGEAGSSPDNQYSSTNSALDTFSLMPSIKDQNRQHEINFPRQEPIQISTMKNQVDLDFGSQSNESKSRAGEQESFQTEAQMDPQISMQSPLNSLAKNLFEAQTKPTQPAQDKAMVDKILNQASLLVKEGGGSIRLQVENPDIGQIDLALSVSEDAVRLRVLSGSDQVKELLISDMPKLRDLLEGQNLKLENIEFARHNHGHEAFSDSRQYQDRPHYQDIFENSFQSANINKSQSPWHKSGQIKYPSTHMGSIQVLA